MADIQAAAEVVKRAAVVDEEDEGDGASAPLRKKRVHLAKSTGDDNDHDDAVSHTSMQADNADNKRNNDDDDAAFGAFLLSSLPTEAHTVVKTATVRGVEMKLFPSYFRMAFGHVPKDAIKMAAFDLDSTLIETQSGKKFGKTADDWKFLFPAVPGKLKELSASGHLIVIFTNQKGLSQKKKDPKKKKDLEEFHNKIAAIAAVLQIPFLLFASTDNDPLRKPATGMWYTLVKEQSHIVKSASFYVGDAAGRPDGWQSGNQKDFSDSDRRFALNLGIAFHTPEEFFLSEKVAKFELDFDPSVHFPKNAPLFTPTTTPLISGKQEVIVLVGFPGSGKSSFSQKYLVPKKYEYINRDTLKTQAKCIANLKAALSAKSSAVIDNTNPDSASRAEFIKIAKEFDVPVRCFVFQPTIDAAMHLNFYRELTGGKEMVPDIAMYTYQKKFEMPMTSEGFSEIKKIGFVPDFETKHHERLFYMHLSS